MSIKKEVIKTLMEQARNDISLGNIVEMSQKEADDMNDKCLKKAIKRLKMQLESIYRYT